MQLIKTDDGLFRSGDPFNGIQGTAISAAWLNTIQSEISAVCIAAGVPLNDALSNQLLTAMLKLMTTAATQPAGDSSTKVATDQFVNTAINGIVVVNIGGGADSVLTQAQWGCGILILTGAITADVNVIVPAQGDKWAVFNRTTGAFRVTVKTANGAGVVVRVGNLYELVCDGADVFSISGGGSGKAARYFLATS